MKKNKSSLITHLQVLCNECGERHSGSPGERKAADYVFKQFKQCGLRPAREYFDAPGWRYGKYSLAIQGADEAISCFPCFFSNPCDLTGAITVLDAPEKIRTADLAGKICLAIFEDMGGGLIGSKNQFAELIDERGAAALILPGPYQHTVDTKTVRTPSLKQMAVVNIPTQEVWKITANRRRDFHLRIDADKFNYQACNVVGRIPGHGKYKAVIGAHYDTAPGTVGAGDNASGTAVLLEVARQLSSLPGFPWGVSVDFVAFAGEEYGGPGMGLGGFEYVRRHRAEVDRMAWMCNLDNIGIALARECVCVGAPWRMCEQIGMLARPFGLHIADARLASDNKAFANNAVPHFWFRSAGMQLMHTPLDDLRVLDVDKMAHVCAAAAAVTSGLMRDKTINANRNVY